MTGVLAHGLWSVSGKNPKESQDSANAPQPSSSSSHVSAGLKGLKNGVFGGLTSMIVEPLEGASKKGLGVSVFVLVFISRSDSNSFCLG